MITAAAAGVEMDVTGAGDHLGSTSLVMDSSGNLLSENRCMPFGETRTISGTTHISETDFGYTGQRDYSDDFDLMDYRARFYSPALGRFTQTDTIVPDPGSSQAWNWYSYTLNNPVKYNDPSGHFATIIAGAIIVAAAVGIAFAVNTKKSGEVFDYGELFVAAGVGALAGGLTGSGIGMLTAGSIGAAAAVPKATSSTLKVVNTNTSTARNISEMKRRKTRLFFVKINGEYVTGN